EPKDHQQILSHEWDGFAVRFPNCRKVGREWQIHSTCAAEHAVHGPALYINVAEADAIRISCEPTPRGIANAIKAGIVERLRPPTPSNPRFQLAIR
ncbi:MAG: hypothetical protein ABI150_07915, partial [Nitrobacter sp.]